MIFSHRPYGISSKVGMQPTPVQPNHQPDAPPSAEQLMRAKANRSSKQRQYDKKFYDTSFGLTALVKNLHDKKLNHPENTGGWLPNLDWVTRRMGAFARDYDGKLQPNKLYDLVQLHHRPHVEQDSWLKHKFNTQLQLTEPADLTTLDVLLRKTKDKQFDAASVLGSDVPASSVKAVNIVAQRLRRVLHKADRSQYPY
jgi:hypothetical protein